MRTHKHGKVKRKATPLRPLEELIEAYLVMKPGTKVMHLYPTQGKRANIQAYMKQQGIEINVVPVYKSIRRPAAWGKR